MGEKLVIGPLTKGLNNRVTQFNIDNTSFPVLLNAFQWRDRVKRKRGTATLTRLTRYINSLITAYTDNTTQTLDGNGIGNLLTGFNNSPTDDLSLEDLGSIVPGTVSITGMLDTYVDTPQDGTLSPSGTINYNSGEIVIAAEAGNAVSAVFRYYPILPVMGIRDLELNPNVSFSTMGFDIKYSYIIQNANPYNSYDVTFFKNPATGIYLNYVQKSLGGNKQPTPFRWNGEDYQNFYTVNYDSAFWASNGIQIPFDANRVGMQFAPSADISNTTRLTATTMSFSIVSNPLVIGDFVFLNEWTSGIAGNQEFLNLQTGYVTNVAGNTITVTFPNANIPNDTYTPGIIQYLTNVSDSSKDCLRWYDGDPTNGSATTPVLSGNNGWVNFCPPLSNQVFPVGGLSENIYYLVTARLIVPFKDRLCFFGPVVQTKNGSPIYLQDTVIYSQNGTPYYTSSFTPTASGIFGADNQFFPILVPRNTASQTITTSAPNAWMSDSSGFGGFRSLGISQPFTTLISNEDVLILGLTNTQTRMIYTSNDVDPFNFYIIDSELGSSSTFSAVNLGDSALTRGNRGFVQTTQQVAQRFDEEIPDTVYQMELTNNGTERIIGQRDYINEWIYFSYPSNQNDVKFPTRTAFFNYIDRSWAIFQESYTAYGQFSIQTGYTWATIGTKYPTWSAWNEPWNAGKSTLLQPQVLAGTAEGFVVIKGIGTGETDTIDIKNISFPTNLTSLTRGATTTVTAVNSFVSGQDVTFSDVSDMTGINGVTGTILSANSTSFVVNIDTSASALNGTGGVATPTYTFFAPNHCMEGGSEASNEGRLPTYIVISGCLGTISSQVNGKVFRVTQTDSDGFNIDTTLDEGTYLGLGRAKLAYVPFIQSKQFPTAWGLGRKTRLGVQQYLLTKTTNGQIQLLLYKSQNNDDPWNDGTIYPDQTNTNQSNLYTSLVYTCPELTQGTGVSAANVNLNQLGNASSSQIWHRMNTGMIGDTVQFGITLSPEQMSDPNLIYQYAEIEFHGAVLDINPSQLLA